MTLTRGTIRVNDMWTTRFVFWRGKIVNPHPLSQSHPRPGPTPPCLSLSLSLRLSKTLARDFSPSTSPNSRWSRRRRRHRRHRLDLCPRSRRHLDLCPSLPSSRRSLTVLPQSCAPASKSSTNSSASRCAVSHHRSVSFLILIISVLFFVLPFLLCFLSNFNSILLVSSI